MDKVALKHLAEHPDVRHNPVAVISIAGATREGKSFLLSLLTMYLESNLDCHWLDKPDTPIPFNFNWKGGRHPETRGVWIWSKPYLVQEKNGTKIALLLMDTQGCFDKSGARNDSNIFTFSTLLSSVQIYNLKNQIKENNLQSLAVFIDYAKESMKKIESIQCFQTLLFLIRDWIGDDDDDFPFGKEGGDKYLEQEVFHYEGNDPDIIAVRDQIRKAFTSTNCVLLPHPGMVIVRGKSKKPGTPICVKDMDDKFRKEIHQFLRFLIDDFTIPLKVGQKDIVGEELLNFTSKLFDLLQTNDIENPASAMEGMSKAKGQTLMQRILREYETTLEIAIKSKCEESVLTRKHEEARKKALQDYDKDSAALHKNHKEPYKERLEKEIEYIFQKHLGSWQANQTILHHQYNEKLLEIIGNYERLLKEKDPSAKKRVNEDFCKFFSDKPQYSQYEEKLKSRMKIIENKMEKEKEIHKREEEIRGTGIIEQLQQQYNTWMNDLGHCTEEGLKTSHERSQRDILQNYEQLFKTRYDHLHHELRMRLVEMLEQSFRNCQYKRLEKENTLRKEYEELVNKTLNDYEKDLEDGKENAKENALTSFYENKPADETYYKEYYEKLVANMKKFHSYFENQQRLKKMSEELKGKEIVERLHKRYNANMDQVGICKDEEFKIKENNIRTKILQDFNKEFTTSFEDLQKEIKEKLMGNLQESSVSKKQAFDVEKNKLRDKYEKLLDDVLTNYKGYLQKRHPNANELAMTDYKKRSPDDKYFYEEYSDKLDNKKKNVLNEYKKNEEIVKSSIRNLVFSISAEYKASMKDAVEKDYSTESDFKKIHDKYEKQALTRFDEELKCPEHFDDIKSSSRNELKEKIANIFVDCSNNRQRKENTLRKKYEELVNEILNNYEKDLEDGKENAKENALTSFTENKPDDDPHHKEYYERLVANMKKFQHHFEDQQRSKKISEELKGKEIIERLHKRYNAFMDQVGICTDEEFKQKENNIRIKILQDFEKEFTTSFKDLQKEIKEKLMGNLQESSVSKKQALDVEKNKLRDRYEKLLDDVLTNYKGYLQKRHPNANELAMTDYKKRSPDDKYFYEEYSDKLDNKKKNVLNEYKKNEEIVELSSHKLVFSICKKYEKSMKDAVEKDYSTESDFKKIHDEYEEQALTRFDEELKCPEHFDDIKISSRNELKEYIEEIFVDCSKNRRRKEDHLRSQYNSAVDEAVNEYTKCLQGSNDKAEEQAKSYFEKRSVNFDKFLRDESRAKLNIELKNNQQKRKDFIQRELENIAQTALEKYQQLMEKEIFPQGNKPKVFPKTKMKIFHDQYKDGAMVHFATASDGIGEKENLKCRKNICKQSIDEKFEEYSAQQEDHRKGLEEFEVEAGNEYRKYMGDVVGNCYMEPHVLEMVHQRFVSVATEKHSHLSEEENAVLYEYLKHSVEDEYDRVSKKVMGRKGLHRELSSDEAVYSVEKAIKGWLRHWAGKIWSLVKNFFGF
ncbi:unnamed protein product [Clavelina lepadiformis]|uniref:GB1/RHD3-type G domain-containing protein n=1 Tax=Clavelina lepadiformis TaxID=159417 RepID=A0ABP0GI39_CLALP